MNQPTPMQKNAPSTATHPSAKPHARTKNPTVKAKASACGDPRFVGGGGIFFFFHGKSNQHFTLVSDQNVQINAHFIGRRPVGRTRDYTWIQALGLLFNDHSFTLSAKKVAEWNNDVDQITFTCDNLPIFVNEGHLSSWVADDESGLVVEGRSRVNSVIVTLPGIVEISASVVPVTKEDSRIHNYQIQNDDCFAHLEVQFRFFGLTDNIEGVLGQTYRLDFKNPVKRGVPMPIMGGKRKYATSSLTSVGCASCIFSPLPKAEESFSASDLSLGPTISSMDYSTGNDPGVVCRR